MKKITLKTKNLILKEWENNEDEIKFLIYNLNDENVIKTLLNPPYPYTRDDAIKFLSTREEEKQLGNYCFKITQKEDGKIVGNININFKKYPTTGGVGYYIEKASWGKGYASEALKEIISFGFKKLKLHKVYAHHYRLNPASGRVMQKCGMEYEGMLREHIYKNGIYHDDVFYGIINKKEK